MNTELVRESLANINKQIVAVDRAKAEIRTEIINVVKELQGFDNGIILYTDEEDIYNKPLKFDYEEYGEVHYLIALRVYDGYLQGVVDDGHSRLPKYIDEINEDRWFNVFACGDIDASDIYDVIIPLIQL